MLDVIVFMGMHPVLSFLLAYLVFRIVNRGFRAMNIAIRGWPPAHCDADGDFKS